MNIDLDKIFQTEEQLQAAAIKLIDNLFPKLRGKVFHPKNEHFIPRNEGESDEAYEKRCLIIMGKFKALGVLAGVPDIIIKYLGIIYCIELKLPGKKPSPVQKELHARWNEDCPQIPVFVATTLREVFNFCSKIIKDGLTIKFS